MMKRVAFLTVMAIVYPLSLVPFRILYLLSDISLLHRLLCYRIQEKSSVI